MPVRAATQHLDIEPRFKNSPAFYASSRAAFREWLEVHHAQELNVWLVIFKKDSGVPSITYDEGVDEALCYGWVDSSISKRDELSFYQYFARRKPKSNWSRVNKEKVARLTAQGLMRPAGQALIDLAKQTGTWTALDDVENLTTPTDLEAALELNPQAFEYFTAFPRSAKRGILEWLLNAKTEATRSKRIAEIVAKAANNERANQPRQIKKT
jgi:uncharacterized protein YdeI (YjbR/CyaY-like superfamily)